MDSITLFTLEVCFRIIKIYKIKKEINHFKPAVYDAGFKLGVTKGITAWCSLEKDGGLESFLNMKDKYDLDKHYIIQISTAKRLL